MPLTRVVARDEFDVDVTPEDRRSAGDGVSAATDLMYPLPRLVVRNCLELDEDVKEYCAAKQNAEAEYYLVLVLPFV